MRPVVVQMGVTLDGFVHGVHGYEEWGLPPEDDEVEARAFPSGTAIHTYRPLEESR